MHNSHLASRPARASGSYPFVEQPVDPCRPHVAAFVVGPVVCALEVGVDLVDGPGHVTPGRANAPATTGQGALVRFDHKVAPLPIEVNYPTDRPSAVCRARMSPYR